MPTIEECCRQLKLSYIRENWEETVKLAKIGGKDAQEVLQALLEGEVERRAQNGVRNRIRAAKFPYPMTLQDYEREHLSEAIRLKISQLQTLDFVRNHENIILIGNPGTGKTALSVCLGMECCLNGMSVRFISIPDLLVEIREAMSLNQLTRYKKRFERDDLVILDEFGYCSFDRERAEVLFNLLSGRSENGSMIVTSNLSVDKWNEVFKDQILTGAIVDRLAYKAHLIDMSGQSYRILATKKWNAKNGSSL